MKEIFMKYNPFTLDTEIEVDGDNYSKKNNFSFNKKKRLQEWIDSFIKKLDDELNYNGSYHIKFHGTKLDYEDINEAIKKLENREIQLEHIKTKEITDRKKEVENIFYEIQNNSYDLENLKSEDLKDRFEKILNSEFEINVIATMSSGKSTLINSLLSKKILPLSNKACTATITKIKDVDTECFIGKAYSKENVEIYSEKELNYDIMKKWNNDKNISTIKIEGDIPFVKSNEIALVMTDTPGPNNSNDESHKQILLDMLDSNKYKPLILYVMNGTQLAISDDNELLDTIISKLKNADKQTRDSFLFVVNKLDEFNEEDNDDNVLETLKEVREYLEKKGVENPNIIPLAALPALLIRSKPQSEKQKKTRDFKVDSMNNDKNLHLEKYISLPPKAKQEIEDELKLATESRDQEKEALIHTGIPSLEKVIRLYIEKYAMAIKIKDLTDLFKGYVNDELNSNKLKKDVNEIRNDEKKVSELKKQIQNINNEISNFRKFDDYNKEVEKNSNKIANDLEIKITEIKEEISTKVTKLRDETKATAIKKNKYNTEKKELEAREYIKAVEAKKHYDKVLKVRKDIEIELKNELKNIIQKSLIETLEELYKEYINRIKKLSLNGNKIIDGENLVINPFEMMEGSIESFKSFDEFKSEYLEMEIEIIEKKVKNEKKWWEFWRWSESPIKTIKICENVEYVSIIDVIETYHDPIENFIRDTINKALKAGKIEISKVQEQFIKTKEQLDNILKNKLDDIYELLQNEEKTSEKIKIKSEEFNKKIEWLKNIKNRIENVIEI